MKTLKIAFTNHTDDVTVMGRGDSLQTPDQIIDLVRSKVPKYFPDHSDPEKIEVKDYELISNPDKKETNSSLLTINVNQNTSEDYCRRNYGYKFTRHAHPKAEGPVGPTRLN